MSFAFRPAASFTERHGVFVGLSGGTNAGKTWSALRLARGIAGPNGKIAVLDTEGGRTLHLKHDFEFDANVMDPPFRPARFAEAAKAVEDAGYDVLLIDSASMEWRGLGGVLEWQEEEFARMGGQEKNKLASWIKPKMAHKAMVYSLLQRRIPIIFSLRAEEKVEKKDGGAITKRWAPVCNKEFPFELTVSFMLQADNKGFIDLSDARTFKMEGAHKAIFRHGDQLNEEHGAALAAWARDSAGARSERSPVDAYELAHAEALKGTGALSAWWSSEGRPHQKALAERLPGLKAAASQADEELGLNTNTAATSEPNEPPKELSQTEDEWALVPAGDWPGYVQRGYDMIDACKSGKDLEVLLAAPKFAFYHAAAKHAPKSRAVLDEEIAKKRKEIGA